MWINVKVQLPIYKSEFSSDQKKQRIIKKTVKRIYYSRVLEKDAIYSVTEKSYERTN